MKNTLCMYTQAITSYCYDVISIYVWAHYNSILLPWNFRTIVHMRRPCVLGPFLSLGTRLLVYKIACFILCAKSHHEYSK